MEREAAFGLLKKYNEEEFHLRHAITVEHVMMEFAKQNGEDEKFWGLVGLLHDVDYEKYPDEHCKKAPELLKEIEHQKIWFMQFAAMLMEVVLM